MQVDALTLNKASASQPCSNIKLFSCAAMPWLCYTSVPMHLTYASWPKITWYWMTFSASAPVLLLLDLKAHLPVLLGLMLHLRGLMLLSMARYHFFLFQLLEALWQILSSPGRSSFSHASLIFCLLCR